jgi:uncharacterized membrane protein YeiB
MAMGQTNEAAARHVSIDAVRGFAVLGILLMNIVGMGLPSFAYIDPTYAGGSTGADLWTWAVNNVLTDGKMRALFTMLFGASAVLIAERAEGGRPGPAATHYRRMFWLFVFGMIHAYFLWWGDVLTLYAVAGLVIFPFRKLSPKVVLGLGAAILLGLLVKNLIGAGHLEALRAAASLPGASADAVKAWQEASVSVIIPPEVKAQEIGAYRGGFLDALQARAQMAMLVQLVLDPPDGLPEAIGQMLIGMALFRMGFFTLGWTTRAYGLLIAAGYLDRGAHHRLARVEDRPGGLRSPGAAPPGGLGPGAQAVHRARPRQRRAADRPGRNRFRPCRAARRRRAHGVQQLPDDLDHHDVRVLRLWSGALWEAVTLRAVGRRGRGLGLHPDLEQALARALPLRTL